MHFRDFQRSATQNSKPYKLYTHTIHWQQKTVERNEQRAAALHHTPPRASRRSDPIRSVPTDDGRDECASPDVVSSAPGVDASPL